MPWLPYHHDWRLAHQASIGLRVHWFGRYAGTADWKVEPSRLAVDMVSFFFVERNSCWAVINGRRWTLNRGDLLVVLGGDEFSLGHDPARPHVSLSVSLALEHGGMANALLCRKFQRRYAFRKPEGYIAAFEKVLAKLSSTSPSRDLEIAGALLQWLAFVMDRLRPPMDRAVVEERSVVDKVLLAEAWANARLRQVITLGDWARAVGLNAVYFGRVFKRETGLRPMEWLNQRRLQMACQHLAGTSKTVTEIAEACGFASPFYFSRVFRRHFDQPPLSYRRTQLRG
ncbi:MAG: AraC family transcriptional regulator [Verrucomicrobia bacterium]|nr:AraC family transcriptional regulator [Verrucomicrobiota bacterium]